MIHVSEKMSAGIDTVGTMKEQKRKASSREQTHIFFENKSDKNYISATHNIKTCLLPCGRRRGALLPMQEEEHQVEVSVEPRVDLQRAVQHRVGQGGERGGHGGGAGAAIAAADDGAAFQGSRNKDQLGKNSEEHYYQIFFLSAQGVLLSPPPQAPISHSVSSIFCYFLGGK